MNILMIMTLWYDIYILGQVDWCLMKIGVYFFKFFVRQSQNLAQSKQTNKIKTFDERVEPGKTRLSVRDGNTLQFVSLLESIRVWRFFGGIDELIGQALSDRFNVSESRLTSTLRWETHFLLFNYYHINISIFISIFTCTQKPDSLIDTSQWWHINSLTTYGTSTTDSCRVFSWTAVFNGIDQDFQWILSYYNLWINNKI